jgi:hypothetical protein
MDRTTFAAISFGIFLALTLAPAPFIQSTGGAYAQQQPSGEQVTDEEIRAYVSAALAVQEIADEYQPRIERTENFDDAERLRVEAHERMVSAVHAEGLDVPKYNEIFQLSQTDAEVRAKVDDYLRQQQ